jgi:hypothetical protein
VDASVDDAGIAVDPNATAPDFNAGIYVVGVGAACGPATSTFSQCQLADGTTGSLPGC